MPDGCLRVRSVSVPLTGWLKQDLVATLSHKGFLFNRVSQQLELFFLTINCCL